MFSSQQFINRKMIRLFSFFTLLLFYTTCDNKSLKPDNNFDQDCFDSSLVNPLTVCPTDYDPVCGCNLQTYTNACSALKSGITRWISGDCGSSAS